MRCRPWRWLWGLLPLALIGSLVVVAERPRIEADLTARTEAALEEAGYSLARPEFGARDGVLIGDARDAAELERAEEIARATWGVRDIRNEVSVVGKVRPFVWSASLSERGLRLEGYVPSEEVRAEMARLAGARFPGVLIDDRTRLATGEPGRDRFLAGLRFGLDQLQRLKAGEARLADTKLSIAGEARSADDFDAIGDDLRRRLPRGLSIADSSITPPVARPYLFKVSVRAARAVLEGYLPDAGLRGDLVRQIKERLPRVAITDRTRIAAGDPAGFAEAARGLIDHLARLDEGEAGLSDLDAAFSGSVEREEDAQALLASLAQALPGGYRLQENVTFRAEKVKTAETYGWTASFSDGSLVIEGMVPDKAARAAVLDEAKRRLPDIRIVDLTEIARGEPAGFVDAARAAIEHLGRLRSGTAALTGGRMRLEGLAATEALAGEVFASLERRLPAGFTLEGGLQSEKAELRVADPYTWSARISADSLRLDGFVPREEMREALLADGRRLAPGRRIEDRMELAAGEPAGFEEAARAALATLFLLKAGEARLEGPRLAVEGTAEDEATALEAASGLRSALPRGFKLADGIGFAKPAVAAAKPYVLAAELENGRLVLEGYLPSEKVRAALMAHAARSHPGVEIVDRLAIAAGHPGTAEEWQSAAGYAIEQLGALKRGRARIEDTRLSISGEALDRAGYDAVAAALRAPPRGLHVDEQRITEPVPGVFGWKVVASGDLIALEGHVPSEETRRKIFDYAAQRFAGRNIVDRMEIARGVPDPEGDWLRSVQTAIRAVSILGEGRASLTNRALVVEGDTAVETVPGRIREIVGQATPAGYTSDSYVTYLGPAGGAAAADEQRKLEEEEARAAEEKAAEEKRVAEQTKAEEEAAAKAKAAGYRFDARYDGLELDLEGMVPSSRSREDVVATARRKLPDRRVNDRLEIREGAPPGWTDAILKALDPLALLEKGRIAIRDGVVRLEGEADNEPLLERARKMLQSGLPSSFRSEEEVAYVAPPKPDPRDVARKEADEKVDVDRLVASDKSFDAGECRAVLNSRVRKLHFRTASFELDGSSKRILNELPRLARRCQAMRISIGGHTDSDGAAKYNQWLSEQRAEAVADYLNARGIDRERLTAVGYGEERPVAENDSAENKAQNRRIELDISVQ